MSKENKRKALQKQLAHCLQWESFHHEAELLQANYSKIQRGMESIVVDDWLSNGSKKLLLDPKKSPKANIEEAFKRARKAKRGVKPLQELLAKLEAAPEPVLILAKPKEEVAVRKPYHLFRSPSGMTILVGRSSRENDLVTFHYAKREDYWFHAQGVSGSHVILRVEKEKEPDEDSIKMAVELAHKHSQAKDLSESPVTMTKVKHIARAGKGKPGKVLVRQQVTRYSTIHPNSLESSD